MGRTQDDIYNEWLVLRCQDGDGDALRQLFKQWQPRLGRLAWRLTADRDAASDVVQDAWLAIVRGLRKLDDPARFRSWAFRIITNKCVDWTRKRVVQRRATEDLAHCTSAVTDETSSSSTSQEEHRRIRDAVASLPNEQRAIVSLHYLEGMSVKEIARVFSLPVGTVKSRLFHARSCLRQAIERVTS